MENQDIKKTEEQFSEYVDKGTQVILQNAIKEIVETFNKTDALEDILSYLEELRDAIENTDEKINQVQQRQKQMNDKASATEVSIANLLQRIQTMELQIEKSARKTQGFEEKLDKICHFFGQSPFQRMFSRLGQNTNKDNAEESE